MKPVIGVAHVMQEEEMMGILAGMREEQEVSLLESQGSGSFCHLTDCCKVLLENYLL